MKMRKYLMLIAALTVSSAFFLGGCSLDLPGKGNDTAIAATNHTQVKSADNSAGKCCAAGL